MPDGVETELNESQCQLLVERSGAVRDNNMFVTDNDRVGGAYHLDTVNGIRPGDVVVGLFAANLPFVLRKLEPSSHYQMVNIAYINDHSQGDHALSVELFGHQLRNRLEKIDPEEYTIV